MKQDNNFTAQWLKKYERVPVWHKVKWLGQNPWQLYLALMENSDYAFIVESGRSGRYTYVGANPVRTIQIKNGTIKEDGKIEYRTLADPLAVVRRWMEHQDAPSAGQIEEAGLPDWTGGAVGYLSYDTARYFELFPRTAKDDLQLPDVYLMMMEEVYAFDHETKEIFLVVHAGKKARIQKEEDAERRLAEMVSLLEETCIRDQMLPPQFNNIMDTETGSVSFTRESFERAVQKVQEYIASGDVFQVNLSVRQTKETTSSAEEVYEILRLLNPSPYMGLLRFPEFQLVSASPELLLQVKGNKLSTRPIAGTRRRGKTEEEDAAFVQELLDNEKEIAEHIMLVDLERNDLGRVSRYGSVHVDELMVVEKYSHVMHIVSNVVGELADDKDMYDAIIAAFPGGTITGAPKVRTMEIIEELEPVTRGPYTGSMCLLGFTGDAVCNIIIRTMVVRDGQVHVQAGAGIVIDSIPKAEYYESLKKAEAVWKALSLSEAKKR